MTYDPSGDPSVDAPTGGPDRGIAMRVELSGGDDGSMIGLTAIRPETDTQIELMWTLDKLMGAAKAVRAKQQLPELRHELDGHREMLRENEVRLAELDAAFRTTTVQREQDRMKLQMKHQEIYENAAADHFASGRQGQFEPHGNIKTSLNRFASAMAQKEGEQTKANEEHKVARSQLENEVKKRQTSVTILERRVAECERLARGEDISGV